jgi:hypothetical protein
MSLVRRDLRDKFSSFLSINDEYGFNCSWYSDPTLRHNIDKLLVLDQYADATEKEIIRHFLNKSKSQNPQISQVGKWHLQAYLQETCYFTCKVLCKQFRKDKELFEAFQVANELISRNNFFANYDPDKAEIVTYAKQAIIHRASDYLSGGNDARSDWGTLYYMSPTRLEENLVSITKFLPNKKESDYIYIHRFYKDVCKPSRLRKKRTEPSCSELQAICNLYNNAFSDRENFVEITTKRALAILQQCIDAIRHRQNNFNNPRSLSDSGSANDADGTQLIDYLSDPSDANQNRPENLERAEPSELEKLQNGLSNVLDQEIASLTLERQGIFTMLHGLNGKMTKIATLYGVNQSNISRRYRPTYEAIFAKCVTFCQVQVRNLDVNLSWQNDLHQWLKGYLNSFYKGKLSGLLESLINSHLQEENQILHKSLDLTEYINAERENLINISADLLINHLQQEFQITQSCEAIVPNITYFIRAWMSDRPTN